MLDLSNGVWYRIRRVLLDNRDLFPDIVLENGEWRDITIGRRVDVPRSIPIDYWGDLEPQDRDRKDEPRRK